MTTVSSATINSDIWKNFRDLINTNVTSVTIQGTGGANTKNVDIQSVRNSYPDEDASKSSDYPIIVINSVNKRYDPVTYRNKLVPGNIMIECFAIQKEAVDKIMDKINNVILTNEATLNAVGIEGLNLEDEDVTPAIRGSIKGHRGMVNWSFEYDL
jgi:hypothetical protein